MWLAQNQDNLSECSNMSIRGMLFQWAGTIKVELIASVSFKMEIIIISSKCYLFSMLKYPPPKKTWLAQTDDVTRMSKICKVLHLCNMNWSFSHLSLTIEMTYVLLHFIYYFNMSWWVGLKFWKILPLVAHHLQ